MDDQPPTPSLKNQPAVLKSVKRFSFLKATPSECDASMRPKSHVERTPGYRDILLHTKLSWCLQLICFMVHLAFIVALPDNFRGTGSVSNSLKRAAVVSLASYFGRVRTARRAIQHGSSLDFVICTCVTVLQFFLQMAIMIEFVYIVHDIKQAEILSNTRRVFFLVDFIICACNVSYLYYLCVVLWHSGYFTVATLSKARNEFF